jgi:hypothetical protein
MFQDVIDFKKQKINWRFKSRMRSNSNEFIEGFPFSSTAIHTNQVRSHQLRSKPGNEAFTCNSSEGLLDEEDWEEDVKGTLVCGVSNAFKIVVCSEALDTANEKISL